MTEPDFREPQMVAARKRIMSEVMDEYDVTREELLGNRRYGKLMEARKDAAHRLHEAGFNLRRIGKILNRANTTISQYFSGSLGERKRDRIRLHRLIEALPESTQAVVTAAAEAKGVHPYAIVNEWLIQRAALESHCSNREAA